MAPSKAEKMFATTETRREMILFGPVPSRRLGRSLGVNNIPPKVCSYSCAYCQVGRTRTLSVRRQRFFDPHEIQTQVKRRLRELRSTGERLDYLSFVPDGEPTLDLGLGRTIALLRPLAVPVAVISNASLLDRKDVQADLLKADWVCFKVDAVRELSWRRLNRPHRSLRLASILEAMLRFRESFPGRLVTETMLVEGRNDSEEELNATAAFLRRLEPETVYLSIPTRPPAESWVKPPNEGVVARSFHLLASAGVLVGFTGGISAAEDLLAITSVHPMRRQAVEALLANSGAGWSEVQALLDQGHLAETEYRGDTFYVRRFPHGGRQAGMT
jgi:wyosine [tRNA(Phe)-imidazoG37] synthetase (radical SAM superfamily)